MKRLLPFILAFGTGTLLNAQITIGVNDFASPGDEVYMGTDNLPPTNLPLGTPGTNKSWDFTTLETRSLDTISFVNPATLPNGAQFPTSNIAQVQGSTIIYLNKQSNSVSAVGTELIFSGFPIAVNFNPGYTVLPFPTNYLDNFGGNYQFEQKVFIGIDTTVTVPLMGNIQVKVDSVWIKRQSDIDANVDAWGNLTTDLAVVAALRAKVVQENVDTTYAYFGNPIVVPGFINITQGWNLIDQQFAQTIALFSPELAGALGNATGMDTITTYEFFANNYDYRFASIEVDEASNQPTNAQFISNESLLVGMEQFESMPDLKVYPNPTADEIRFSQQIPAGTVYKIFDMKGTLIEAKTVNSNVLSLQNLSSGSYAIMLYHNDGKLMAMEKVVVRK
ncbi:MAG: T9SS type A sorting domain-containing protein [Flavobacteriales bacterium]